jgi:hypothetical protein
LVGDGVFGFILILTIVDFGGVVGLEASPFESARTNWTLSSTTTAAVVIPKTGGLRYTDVLLETMFVAMVCTAFGPDSARSLCCNRGLAGKIPEGAGGLLDGFSTSGIAAVPPGVFAYA